MTDQELTALMKTPGEFPAAFGRYLRVTAALTPEGSGQRITFDATPSMMRAAAVVLDPPRRTPVTDPAQPWQPDRAEVRRLTRFVRLFLPIIFVAGFAVGLCVGSAVLP